MAKCDLSIELDDPQKIHPGGGTVSGVVRVRSDADVQCNSLEVKSVWRTHGRGNVATGEAGSATLFSGQWNAGEAAEYRFELPVADWPPTYEGHYLNIDHYVDARAKVPWSFDPKASVPFRMLPTCGPEGAVAKRNVIEIRGILGCVIGLIVLMAFVPFALAIVQIGPFALLFLMFPLVGLAFFALRVWLPKFALGDVHYHVSSEQFTPGQEVTGELVIRPRKNVTIQGIRLDFQAREQCVSGSGSNRTTHKHVFFEQTETLAEATTLRAGQEHRFPLAVTLPRDAPHTIDLNDNDLIWSATLRVEIPRWPDWVKEIPLLVIPAPRDSSSLAAAADEGPAVDVSDSASAPATAAITFAETASHVWSLRDDREQVEGLVEAVSGLTFDLEAVVERRLLYSGAEDPHVYPDGYAVWAHYPEPALPMVLYVPHELADEFEQAGRENWRGRGTIVGWDGLHGRLQVKLERPGQGRGPEW